MIFVSLLIVLGTVPVSKLSLILNSMSVGTLPMLEGIVPDREFRCMSKTMRLVRLPSWVGMDPTMLFEYISRYCSFCT
jgi:hypothetical protein